MQLSALNEECLVGVGHHPTPIVSLPFVHTARRCYRWLLGRAFWTTGPVGHPPVGPSLDSPLESGQYSAARGSKSRNKVAVGEPAAGSLLSHTTPPEKVSPEGARHTVEASLMDQYVAKQLTEPVQPRCYGGSGTERECMWHVNGVVLAPIGEA